VRVLADARKYFLSVSELRLAWRLWPRDLSWRDGGAAARLAHLSMVWLQHRYYPPYDILQYIDLFLGCIETPSASQLQNSSFNRGGKWHSLHGIIAPLFTRDETC
jgi:hypothetical protein